MLTLANAELSVAFLDPAAPDEQRHQGVRYCHGGYIWQVTDARAGPLLRGPQWPESNPTPHNGQGLPESFRHRDIRSQRPLMLRDGHGWIIGIGEVAPDPAGQPVLTRPCAWAITAEPTAYEFRTAQAGDGYAAHLTRRVTLAGRTLVSSSRVTNSGDRPLPLHWFAHPFFALTDRLLTCDLPAGTTLAENPGYALDAHARLSFKRRFEGEHDGHHEPLRLPPGLPFRARLSHPRLAGIDFTTDFAPDHCPVWGNAKTWSIEPFLMTDLAPGATRAWSLRYDFGPARS